MRNEDLYHFSSLQEAMERNPYSEEMELLAYAVYVEHGGQEDLQGWKDLSSYLLSNNFEELPF
jgi:hypothetical protein